MSEIIKSADTGKGTVYLYGIGILHQVYNPGVELDYQDSLKEFEIYKTDFCDQTSRPILVDLDNVRRVSKESRGIYSSDDSAEIFSAAALLVGNPVSRIMGNFYMGINKTPMPIKMFTKKDEAFKWLKTFIKE
jgi:hypothetical protein